MKLFTLFTLTRPKFQVPAVVSYLIGILLASWSNFATLNLYCFITGLMIVSFLVTGGSLVLNQYFDYELDKRDKKLSPLIKAGIKKISALYYAFLLFTFGLISSFFINLQAVLVTFLGILISILYSAPPIRLKGVKYLDSLSNGIAYGFLPTFLGFIVMEKHINLEVFLASLPLFFGYTGGHMLLALPDIPYDKSFGVETTAVSLGRKRTSSLAFILFVCMFLVFFAEILLKIYPLSSIICLLPLPFILKNLIKLVRQEKQDTYSIFKELKILFSLEGVFLFISFLIPFLL